MNYKQLLVSLRSELERNVSTARKDYDKKIVLSKWNSGKFISQHLLPSSKPSKTNARIIKDLSKDLNRPASHIYSIRKFYQVYPVIPKSVFLRWSHYNVLIRIKDKKRREAYERIVEKEKWDWKYLQRSVADENRRIKLNGMLSLDDPNMLIAQLPVFKGKLYSYKVIDNKSVRLKKNCILLDLGFNMRREIKTDARFNLHGGHCISSCKTNSDYEIISSSSNVDALYTNKAFIERVVDGDTVIAHIDCGFQTWTKQRLRLRGIDSPEIKTSEGMRARKFVQKELAKVGFIVVKTYKQGKFGRYLADIFYLEGEDDPSVVASRGIFINQSLLDNSLALAY